LTTVISKEGCLIDEPDYYTYHARSGTLVVFYNEAEQDQFSETTLSQTHDLTDLSIRAWIGHSFPGEKLKPSVSRGCRLCRRGYVHEFSRRITDDCVDEQCICEKTGETAAFDTVDKRGECGSARGRAYFCACRDNCSVSETSQFCNVPLTHQRLPRNIRTTISSQYSDLSSEDWGKSAPSVDESSSTKSSWTTWSSEKKPTSTYSSSEDSTSSSSESESESRSSWSSVSSSESESESESESVSSSWTWTDRK